MSLHNSVMKNSEINQLVLILKNFNLIINRSQNKISIKIMELFFNLRI